MASEAGVLIGPPEARADYNPLLRLILVNVLAVTGLGILWRLGLLELVISTDHTRVSLIIFAILVGTTLHCFYQTISVSRELIAARRVRQILENEAGTRFALGESGVVTTMGTSLPQGILSGHISALVRKSQL